MAMLFNTELKTFSPSTLFFDLQNSPLNSKSAEIAILNMIQDMQDEENELLESLEGVKNKFKKMSEKDMFLSSRYIIAQSEITISGESIRIDSFPDGDGTEFIVKGALQSLYSPFIYKFGNIFKLTNIATSDSIESSDLTMVMTNDSVEKYFLSKKSGEYLTSCTLSSYSDVLYELIDEKAALPIIDIKQLFYSVTDTLDLNIVSVSIPGLLLTEAQVSGEKIDVKNAVATSLEVNSGAVTKETLPEYYVSTVSKTVSNNSPINRVLSRNVRTVNETRFVFRTNIAPKTGWISTDLKKNTFKSDAFLELFADSILESVPVSENPSLPGINSGVSRGELSQLLTKVKFKLSNMEICNDN